MSPRSAKHFADLALAGDLPDLAGRFAENIPDSVRGGAITRAKLLWYRGHMTQAVEMLENDGKDSERLGDRYRGEAEVFGSWTPQLPRVGDFVPTPHTVLHLVTNSLPYTESGYAQRTHSILREQFAAGWVVHAATRLGYPQSVGSFNASELDVIDRVNYHRLASNGRQGNLRERQQQEAEALLELVLRLRPSVLHTTTHFANGLTVRAVAEAVGIPWVYEVRGQLADTWASQRGPEAVESERYLSFQRRETEVANAADGVVTLGAEMRQGLVDAGVARESIRLAPNGVGEEFLKEPTTPSKARRELGLPVQELHIGTVSSLVTYEGLDTLIQAFGQLTARRDGLRLLIVGDGAAAPALRRQAAAVGLDPAEVLPGRVPREEAAHYHQALDIFVVPRQDHAVTRAVTPLKPVEAMASSRPVVVSDLPALREIVTDSDTGITVEAGDVVGLATALERLVDDAELRASMGSRGREIALTERTWTHSASASLDQYATLTGRGSTEDE
ncbi:glycosyltransferase family 4 protein [Arthrobacter rhombi]|uniref:glycosyltransferase family 4 protein n=1 Tax=Arthrobacter rhombi TaxID=71253 RepID=UPI003FD3964F